MYKFNYLVQMFNLKLWKSDKKMVIITFNDNYVDVNKLIKA